MRNISPNYRKPNKKKRRHSGRRTIASPCPGVPDMTYYDTWTEYRDGGRGYEDKTKFHNKGSYCFRWHSWSRYDKKLQRQLKIRKAKKNGRSIL